MSKKVEERVKGMWVWGSRLAVYEYVAQGSSRISVPAWGNSQGKGLKQK